MISFLLTKTFVCDIYLIGDMMNIKKIEKIKNDKYKIIFDDEFIITYDNVIIENNLLYKKNIDKNMYNNILVRTKYYDAYNKLVKYIMKKRRSKKESIEYLKKNFADINDNDINNIIKKLESLNIINDYEYCKAFINDKICLNNSGINKIRKELLFQQIDEKIIDEELKKIDSELLDSKLKILIIKKIKNNKKYSNCYLRQKIVNEMVNLGYDKNKIIELIDLYLNKDDVDILKSEFLKQYNKFSKKYNKQELFIKIKQNLLSKGFELYNINELLLELKKED